MICIASNGFRRSTKHFGSGCHKHRAFASSLSSPSSSSSSSSSYSHIVEPNDSSSSSSVPPPQSTSQQKRLDVAIVGAPNAGKSQLLNVLTQSPVAAVSRKRHTTRTDILGARTIGDTQIVFKDTPGFLRLDDAKKERLNRELIVNAAAEMEDVDYSLLVIDAARTMTGNYRHALIQLMVNAMKSKGRLEEDEDIEDYLAKQKKRTSRMEQGRKFGIVLNKVDLVKPKSKLLEIAMDIGAMADVCLLDYHREKGHSIDSDSDDNDNDNKSRKDKTEGTSEEQQPEVLDFHTLMDESPITFYVSALQEEGTEGIIDHLLDLATPCGNWAVPAGQSTDMTSEEQIQELIREKIYRCLHRELPHSIQQVNRMCRRVPQGMIIHQDLVVFTKSHHRLVLGREGKTLQRIQDTAVRDLETIFSCSVVLQLHVKLNKSKQRRNPGDYSAQSSSQSIS